MPVLFYSIFFILEKRYPLYPFLRFSLSNERLHEWLGDLHYPFPAIFAYAGKAAELLGGISLLLGLWMRIFLIPFILTLLLITFTMGHGKIFTNDQHPFVPALLCAVFFCNVPTYKLVTTFSNYTL